MSSPDDELRVYDQLCESYRAIDDFRAKLLGFLPLATGTGIWALLDRMESVGKLDIAEKGVLVAVGVFGAFITLGLFAYELYGIKKCGALIESGKRIEVALHIEGQFRSRPRNVASFVNEPFSAGIIYPTVLAAWVYFSLAFSWPAANPLLPLLLFGLGFGIMLRHDYLQRRKAKKAMNYFLK